MVNVLVTKELAEARRDAVRTAAFVVAHGVLERRAGEQRTLVATSLRELAPTEVLAMPSGKSWA
jgi:hypothetical protein